MGWVARGNAPPYSGDVPPCAEQSCLGNPDGGVGSLAAPRRMERGSQGVEPAAGNCDGSWGGCAAQASDRTDGTVPFGLSRAKGRCLPSRMILVCVHFQALQRACCRAFCGLWKAGREPEGWGGGVGRPLSDARASVGQAAARQWHRSRCWGVERPTFRQGGCGHYEEMAAGRNRLSSASVQGQVQDHRSMIAHLVGVVTQSGCGLVGVGQ